MMIRQLKSKFYFILRNIFEGNSLNINRKINNEPLNQRNIQHNNRHDGNYNDIYMNKNFRSIQSSSNNANNIDPQQQFYNQNPNRLNHIYNYNNSNHFLSNISLSSNNSDRLYTFSPETMMNNKMKDRRTIKVGKVLKPYSSTKYPYIEFHKDEEVLLIDSFDNFYLVENSNGLTAFIPCELIYAY